MRRRYYPSLRWVAAVGVCLSCADAPNEGNAAGRLDEIAEDVWNRSLERDVPLRLREGLPVQDLPDITYARAEEDAAFAQSVLDRLSIIDRGALDHDRALSFDILQWQAETEVEGLQYFWLQSFLTPYSSPLPALRQIFEGIPLNTPEDVAGYLALLQQVPDYVRNIRSVAQGQMERGVVVSRTNMPAVVGLVGATVQPARTGRSLSLRSEWPRSPPKT